MTKVVSILAAIVAAFTLVPVAFAADPTPTPEPAAKLAFNKTATAETDIGGIVGYTISVTNSGNADSDSQTMQDTLPAGVDWYIAADSWGCTLAPSVTPGRTVLRCGPAVAGKRHLNATEDDFVNGQLSVTVFGQAYQCGAYFNVAVFNGQVPSTPAIASVRCPATPTPIPATPTPTSVATATPTPTQPPAPTATVAPPTPTVALTVPLAPKTGDSAPTVQQGESEVAWSALAALGGIILFGLSIAGWRRYR